MKKITRIVMLLLMSVLWNSFDSFAQQLSDPLTIFQKRELFTESVNVFQEKNYEKAVQLLLPLVDQYPELEDYVRYFLAESYRKLDRPQEALALFQDFLDRYPSHPLGGDVQFAIANLLFDLERYHEALTMYKDLHENPTISQGDLFYKLGQAFMNIEHYQEAVSAFHHFLSQYPGHAEKKSAQTALQKILAKYPQLSPKWTEETLLDHANALFKSGLYTSAIKQYEAFLHHYPQSARKEESEFGIADAYFRLGQVQKGINALEQIVTRYATTKHELAAKALYTIGTKHWNADRNQPAEKYMKRIIQEFGETSWGDDAYYVLGRIFQSKKAYKTASQWYSALYVHYPDSSFAAEALWQAGWSYYLNKQYAEAIQVFSQATTAFPSGDYRDESFYWQGRGLEQQKKPQAAIKTYRQLVESSPGSYYGLKAQERLRMLNATVNIEQKNSEEQPAFSSLLTRLQQEMPPTFYQEITQHLAKAFELHEVHLQEYVRKEIAWVESLLEGQSLTETTLAKQLFDLYFLGRCYAYIGEYLKTIQLASEIESLLQKVPESNFSYPLEQLKYPLAYWDIITIYAEKNALDPFLVAGIIRQESAYNPGALSYANARGLMQVIPSTGKHVAQQLGIKNFKTAQLYDTKTNIAIGTKYLAGLIQRFDGNLYRAIAGYNAGPNATNKWWPASGTGDQEEIVENITYRATRNYVKRVLRNQYNYQRIYSN
ncbi:tetratricopeptide repeat protein [bacterium]|nr:tetratricopeptide repeat protein [candidate division CSSED10-310 bacterium]